MRAYALGDKPISARKSAVRRLVVMPTRSRSSTIWVDGFASIASPAAATLGWRRTRLPAPRDSY